MTGALPQRERLTEDSPHRAKPGISAPVPRRSALNRRMMFEQAHPDVSIVTPLKSESGHWEASWLEDGELRQITSADAETFFNELEKRFTPS